MGYSYAQQKLGKHFGTEPLSWYLKLAGILIPPVIDYIDKILTRNSKLKDIGILVSVYPEDLPAGPLISSINKVLEK